jgi:hypothetical protein
VGPCQHDSVLDNLPPLKEEGDKLVLAKERIVFTQAKTMFLGRFPQGFEDPDYMDKERNFKWEAHEFAVGCLGNGVAGAGWRGNAQEASTSLEIQAHIRFVDLVLFDTDIAEGDGLAGVAEDVHELDNVVARHAELVAVGLAEGVCTPVPL